MPPPLADSPTQRTGDLSPGELRYFSTIGVVVEIVSVGEDEVEVDRLPERRRIVIRSFGELRAAPVVDPDGFRMRWNEGGLDSGEGAEQGMLQAILRDEVHSGQDRIHFRVLNDYLGVFGNRDDIAVRLKDALQNSDLWARVGQGSTTGYALADGPVDWRTRWERDGISAGDTEAEAEALERLKSRLNLSAPMQLGQIAVCGWLPRKVRDEASDLLVAALCSDPKMKALRRVSTDALALVLPALTEKLDETGRRRLVAEPALSPALREQALALWLEVTGTESIMPIIRAAGKHGVARVGIDLVRLSRTSGEAAEALAVVFRSAPPGEKGQGVVATKALRAALDQMGVSLVSACVSGATIAIHDTKQRHHLMGWLARLSPADDPGLLGRLVVGIATMTRLSEGSTKLDPLSMPRPAVRSGLVSWLDEELGEESARVDFELGVGNFDKTWERRVLRGAATLQERCDFSGLGDALIKVAPLLVVQQTRMGELAEQTEDPENARRVLRAEAATQVRGDREELVESARAQIEQERLGERRKVAQLVCDSVTAIERAFEAEESGILSELGVYIRGCANDLQLTIVGSIGDEVVIDPSLHDATGSGGDVGEVRRVGIAEQDGILVIKPRVVPSRRLT